MDGAKPVGRRLPLALAGLIVLGILCFWIGDRLLEHRPSLTPYAHLAGSQTILINDRLPDEDMKRAWAPCAFDAPEVDASLYGPFHQVWVKWGVYIEHDWRHPQSIVLWARTTWSESTGKRPVPLELRRLCLDRAKANCPPLQNIPTELMLAGESTVVLQRFWQPHVGYWLVRSAFLPWALAIVPLTIILARLGGHSPYWPAGLCRRCKYDISTLPAGTPCPECGATPSRPPRVNDPG